MAETFNHIKTLPILLSKFLFVSRALKVRAKPSHLIKQDFDIR